MQGTSYLQLEKEYSVAKSTISGWVKNTAKNADILLNHNPIILMQRRFLILIKKLPNWKRKTFSKKSRSILPEGTRLVIYQFTDENKDIFGLRWLFRH